MKELSWMRTMSKFWITKKLHPLSNRSINFQSGYVPAGTKNIMLMKKCDIPLDTCTSFGFGADYLIRNNLAKEVSKKQMLEHFARSKELGLVFNADNVQKNITFICHCCGCCCNILLGISKFGYPNFVVTSNYIAEINEKLCIGCGKCAKACKIDAIQMVAIETPQTKKKKDAKINKEFCIGCGVCAIACPSKAMKLVKRDKRVITPETVFERIILQSFKAGNLQNHIFDNPQTFLLQQINGSSS